MTQDQRIPLPSGLPKRFSNGQPGYRRLLKFLEIPNAKSVEAVLDAVKHGVQRVPGKLRGAERRRVALTALYGNPESRRELWRQALDAHPPDTSRGQPVASLEFAALQRHDAEFRQREIDTAAAEDALRDFPGVVESVADAPQWQRPALAAWPTLQRDIAEWNAVPHDRREATALALFAIATILDDVRLLRGPARRVHALGEEFAFLLRDDSESTGDALLREWQTTCERIAGTLTALSADPPQPDLVKDLEELVRILASLRDPLVRFLERPTPEQLFQRVVELVRQLGRKYHPSPLTGLRQQIEAHWRLVYSLRSLDEADATLAADVQRLDHDLQESLTDWADKQRSKSHVEERLQEGKRLFASASDPTERNRREDECVDIQDELTRAVKAVRNARDRVYHAAGPIGQQFDPRRDYLHQLPTTGGEANETVAIDTATTDTETTDTETTDTETTDTEAPQDEATDAGAIQDEASDTQDDTTDTEDKATDAEASHNEAIATGPTEREATDTAATEDDGTAIWTALRNGRFGIAYHIARCLSADASAPAPTTSADLIAASALAPHVRSPDGRFAQALGSLFESLTLATPPEDCPQSDRDALNLLLFSATVRPALLAPASGAASLLRTVSMSEGLTPVYDIAQLVAASAERLQGVRLVSSSFSSGLDLGWQEESESLSRDARDWRTKAPRKRNLYGPANDVWRKLLASDGILTEVLTIVIDGAASDRARAEELRELIQDYKAFADLVQRVDRKMIHKGPKATPIHGTALRQLWDHARPVSDFLGRWLSLVATKPQGSEGFVDRQLADLRHALERRAEPALAAIDHASAPGPNIALAATLPLARDAIRNLQDLFAHDLVRDEPLAPAATRSRDLLYVTALNVDAEFTPRHPEDDLHRLLVAFDEHAPTMPAAMKARLERGDLVGAKLALRFIETEDDPDREACAATFFSHFRDRRANLETKLLDTERQLEAALCRGQLPADDRDRLRAALVELREHLPSRRSGSPSLHEVATVVLALHRLASIAERVVDARAKSIAGVRKQLQEAPADRLDGADRSTIEAAIQAGYVWTAHEQIARVLQGEPLQPPPVPETSFGDFTAAIARIEAARTATGASESEIVRAARSRQAACGVEFGALSPPAAESAADLVDAWYRLARKGSLDANLLRDVLERLGFRVRETRQVDRRRLEAEVRTDPIEDRGHCPSRQYGSQARGRYRVFRNSDELPVDSILRSVGDDAGAPAIVLYFGCLRDHRERLRQRAVEEHRLLLVVDESLILFLAGRETNRLSCLFRCTLPYSAAEPYATTSGLVPPELFYGREAERRAIMDQSGACFIYGGRQMGKTALLRRVEHDFQRTPEHAAKWIDLGVNDIDRAPDIWRVLQRELQREGVIQVPSDLDPDSKRQVEDLLERIRRWLVERTGRRLLLLLDEADHFLVVDANNDFRESWRLKGLMDDTDRRFKVVFAGLHNVLRTARQGNHPLGHLGDPIRVGAMLTNGEWEQAQMLVREPLHAVGCKFGRDDLSTRILAHTNYYPSLIQLFGAELMRGLRDSDKPFPYELSDDDLDRAHRSGDLGTAIGERFRLTLRLDPRYEVIAYALAHDLRESSALSEGRQGAAILDIARSWWPDGFALTGIEFNILLHEMEGLGVLRAVGSGYTLRNPNILALLGSQQEIEDALLWPRELATPYAPASFRAGYPQDPPSSPRRGPLTREQESRLRRAGVAVICGCPAAGLEDAGDFLSQRIQREFRRLGPAENRAEFEDRVRRLEPIHNSVTVSLVPASVQWDWSWIESCTRILRRRARGKRVLLRAAFLATPERLWQLLGEAGTPEMDTVDWFELGPCDERFIGRWLEDITVPGNAKDLLEVSGGWPTVLEVFAKKRAKTWRARMDALGRELEKRPEAQLRDRFGVSGEAAHVFHGLAIADEPFDEASVELVAGEVDRDVGEVQRRVLWGERLRLLSRTEDGRWKLNPLVKRLLEACGPD